jgi:hypothetical protein
VTEGEIIDERIIALLKERGPMTTREVTAALRATEPFDEKVHRELDVLLGGVHGTGAHRNDGLANGLRMSRAHAAARRAIAGLSKDDARRVVIDLLIDGSSTDELEQLRRAFEPPVQAEPTKGEPER